MRITYFFVIMPAIAFAGSARAQYYNPYAQQYIAQQIYQQQVLAAQQAELQRQMYLQQQAELQRQMYLQQQAELQRQMYLRQQADAARQAMAVEQLSAKQREEQYAANVAGVEIATHGWGRLNARVQNVISELQDFSGASFRVVPSQQYTWGQAHNGGSIFFDVSSAVQSTPILAFRLAHEWGHEVLGHAANVLWPAGRPRLVLSATQDEDEADKYAGKFLCSKGYDIEAIKRELGQYPALTGDSHSSGVVRARNVQAGCDAAN